MADIGGGSQRDGIKQISPPWLATGTGEKVLYDFGVLLDVLGEKVFEAALARMPTRADPSALPFIGTDRLMGQGPNESTDNYRVRLQQAFDSWQHAGTRRAVLAQVLGYTASAANVQPYAPQGTIVSSSTSGTYSVWDRIFYGDPPGTVPAHVRVAPANWNWDGLYRWWWAYLILHFPLVFPTGRNGSAATLTASGTTGFTLVSGLTGMSASDLGGFLHVTGAASGGNNGYFEICQVLSANQVWVANSSPGTLPDANNGAVAWAVGLFPNVGPDLAWGTPGTLWGDDPAASWGLNVSVPYVSGLLSLVRLWKSANTYYPAPIISFEATPFSTEFKAETAVGPGTGNPDGNWANYSTVVGGVSVLARDAGQALSKFDAFLSPVS